MPSRPPHGKNFPRCLVVRLNYTPKQCLYNRLIVTFNHGSYTSDILKINLKVAIDLAHLK